MHFMVRFQPAEPANDPARPRPPKKARLTFEATALVNSDDMLASADWIDQTFPIDIRQAPAAPPWIRCWPGAYTAQIVPVSEAVHAPCEAAIRAHDPSLHWTWIDARFYDDCIELVYAAPGGIKAFARYEDGNVDVTDIPW